MHKQSVLACRPVTGLCPCALTGTSYATRAVSAPVNAAKALAGMWAGWAPVKRKEGAAMPSRPP